MTREEAKDYIREWCPYDRQEEIIKALEQEPCEDYISRADAIDALGYNISIESDEGLDAYKTVIKEMLCKIYDAQKENIEKLPSIQPKTGHWIAQPSNEEQDERPFIWWKCSECGQVIYSETEQDRREYHAYCGRCGAKMIGPQESEE